MNDLRAALTTAGLDASRLRVVREHPEQLLTLVVPAHEATSTWHQLRLLEPVTGHLPLNVGPDEELANLDQAFGVHERALPAWVAATEALAFDLDRWTADALRAQIAALADMGDLRGATAVATALAAFEGRVPLEGPVHHPLPPEASAAPTNLMANDAPAFVHLALLPTRTPWHAPLHVRFGGHSDWPGPAVHAAMLRAWGPLHGASLMAATRDSLEMSVARPPLGDFEAFRLACQQYAYCPNLVEQAAGSIAALAASLRDSPRWTFWWD